MFFTSLRFRLSKPQILFLPCFPAMGRCREKVLDADLAPPRRRPLFPLFSLTILGPFSSAILQIEELLRLLGLPLESEGSSTFLMNSVSLLPLIPACGVPQPTEPVFFSLSSGHPFRSTSDFIFFFFHSPLNRDGHHSPELTVRSLFENRPKVIRGYSRLPQSDFLLSLFLLRADRRVFSSVEKFPSDTMYCTRPINPPSSLYFLRSVVLVP